MTDQTNIDRAAEIIERFLPPLPGSLGAMQAEKTAHALSDAGLLTPGPRIVRTRDELAALDPDTLLFSTDGTGYAFAAEKPQRTLARGGMVGVWWIPAVVIATGDQVRAARQALEDPDAVD